MVGIFSGRLLGLTGGSGDVLGGAGLLGSGSLGRGGEQVYVNATTGNLVLSKQDEFLVGKGADANVSRTYNSLTTLADDNGDDWRQSTDRRVYGLTGTLNTAGSTVRRVSGDGTEIVYTWNASWRNGSGAYVATDGSGAYDAIVKSGAEWVWYDGDTSARESYYDETAAAGLQGKIKTLKDAVGLGVTYAYDASSRLSTITTSDGSWLRYDYADATSANITQVVTGYTDLSSSTAKTLTRTRYGYDASNRLSTVTVDLSPEDSSISDGATYVTTYGYDAAGHVTSITQSDGSALTIAYESTAPTARVTSLTETAASGVIRTTSFAYAASTLFSGGVMSSITDPSGQVTVLETDGAGNLRRITAPLIAGAAARQLTQFTYTANGDLASVIDYAGKVTSYGNYTVDGQARTITDTLGNVVTRAFGSIDRTTGAVTVYSDATPYAVISDGTYISNVLLSETSKGVDQSGASIDEVTRYVYDKYGGLRYTISPEGRVKELVRSSGVVTTEVEYPEALYTAAGVPGEAELNAWRDALPDRSSVVKVNYGYDARFNIRQITTYGSYTATGGGQTTDGSSTTLYSYDQAGQLLSKNASGYNTTTYVYDGMGRVKAAADVNGGTTTYVYNDAATTTTITYASGYVVTKTYNKAGDLISQTDSGANTAGGTTSYAYDKLGRVRVRTDAVGSAKTYYIYDNAGRKVGEVDNAGYVTEYRYDSLNRLIGTIHYRNATTFSLTTLADPDAAVAMSAIRPNTPTAQDMSSWTVYDSEDRVVQTIAGDGSVKTMAYDAAGRLQQTTQFATKLSAATMSGFFSNPPGAFNLAPNASFDAGTQYWNQWGMAGTTAKASPSLVNGKMTTTFQSSSTGSWFGLYHDAVQPSDVKPGQRLAVSEQIGLSGATGNIRLSVEFRDASGNFLIGVDLATFANVTNSTVNASGFVDVPANASQMRVLAWGYPTSSTLNTDLTISVSKPMVSIAGSAQTGQPAFSATPSAATNDSVSRNFYDDDGLLIGTLDGEGYLTRNEYDNAGRLLATTAYANATSSANRASGSWTTLLAGVGTSAQDRVTHLVYDGRGLLRFKVDSLNQVTTYQYANNIDKPVSVQVYTTGLPATSDYTFDNVKRLVFGDANTAAMTAARTSYNIYDAAGRLSYAIDAAGSVTGYAYDTMGRVTRTVAYATARVTTSQPALNTMDAWSASNISNTANRITRTFYTERGEAAYVVDGEGYVRATSYDADGRPLSTTLWNDPVAATDTTMLADLIALLPIASDTNSVTTAQSYDALGRVFLSTDGMGVQTRYTYLGSTSLVLSRVEAVNQAAWEVSTDTWDYDAAGRVKTATQASGLASDGAVTAVTSTTYDGKGQTQASSFTNTTEMRKTFWEYDRSGRITTSTDAAGGVTRYEYNAFGEVWKTTDPNGGITYRWYDKLGRVTTVRDAENYLTTTAYTSSGEVQSVSRYYDPTSGAAAVSNEPDGIGSSATTTFEYDRDGRIITTIDAMNGEEKYSYNAFGELKSVTNKLGGTTTYAYDRVGNVVRQSLATSSLGQTSNYDAASDSFISGAETATRYEYDSRRNRKKVVEGYATSVGGTIQALRTTGYDYDAADRVILVTYDAVTVIDDDMTTTSVVAPNEQYAYDARGNIIRSIDKSGAKTYAYYDDLDRKVGEIRQLDASAWVQTVYVYDKVGNLTSTRVYATALTTEPALGGAAPTPTGTRRQTDYTYDALNRQLTSVVVSTSLNEIVSGSWNTATGAYETNRGAAVVADQNLTTKYEYDANGNVLKQTDPSGNVTTNWYDKLNRRTAKIDAEGYLTTWNYDSEGNVSQETRYATKFDGVPSANAPEVIASAADRVTQYMYDANSNRTQEKRLNVAAWAIDPNTGTLSADRTESIIGYEYNALGQVTTKTVAGSLIATYIYDKAGRLITEKNASYIDANGNEVTPAINYTYDSLGNLVQTLQIGANTGFYTTADRLTVNRYSEGGRLLSTTDAEGNIRFYFYDAAGRIKKEAYNRIVNTNALATVSTSYTIAEAQAKTYDLGGRVTTQSTWTTANGVFQKIAYTSYRYNVYNQVSQQGQGSSSNSDINAGTALFQVANQYDGAGRLVGSNAGNGVWVFYAYDKNGNQTAKIDSAGYAFNSSTGFAAAFNIVGQDDVNGSYTVYDKRGLATQIVEEGRNLSASLTNQTLTTYREYNAFGEVVSSRDRNGAVTTYTYNNMGRLLRTEHPVVQITLENGLTIWVKPAEDNYYDLAGRKIGVRNANGAYGATGNSAATAYSKAANTGVLTSMLLLAGTGYDKAEGSILTEFHADGGKKQTLYDIVGDARVIRDEMYDPNVSIYTHYNEQNYNRIGQLVQVKHARTTNLAGDENRLIDIYVYDQFGQRLQHYNNQFGGVYIEKTNFDAVGRVTSQTDFEGYVTSHIYTWNGALGAAGLNSAGGWIDTTVYANGKTSAEKNDIFGHLIERTDLGGHKMKYTYDSAGRLVKYQDITTSSTTGAFWSYVWKNIGRQDQVTSIDGGITTFGYDRTGNVVSETMVKGGLSYKNQVAGFDAMGRMTSWSDTASQVSTLNLAFSYDAVGNVRYRQTLYQLSPGGSQSAITDWYRYDVMDRMIVDHGVLMNNVIQGGTTDATTGKSAGFEYTYDRMGNRKSKTDNIKRLVTYFTMGRPRSYQVNLTNREFYNYDGSGQLERVIQRNDKVLLTNDGFPETQTPDAVAVHVYTRDKMGRVVVDGEATKSTNYYYLKNNLISYQINYSGSSNTTTNFYYNDQNGLYYLGQAVKITSQSGSSYQTTQNTYVWFDGAVKTTTNVTASGMVNPGNSSMVLDAFGRTVSVSINGPNSSNSTYLYDSSSQGIQKVSGSIDTWYRMAGVNIWHYSDRNGYDAKLGDVVGQTYTANAGDTLMSVAQAIWGDSSLWYKLAEANGLGLSDTLVEGQAISVPAGVWRVHQNASTYLPYDVAQFIGATDPSPTFPLPPAGDGCGIFGQILLAAIAVAVTVIAPISAGPFSGMLNAMLGSVVSQGIGVATGIQDEFSFKAVAMAGLSAGLAPTSTGSFIGDAISGAITNAAVQGIGVATGLQDSFSWAGVAAAGISFGVMNGVSRQIAGSGLLGVKAGVSTFTNRALSTTAAAMASAATRSAISGEDFGDSLMAQLPSVLGQIAGSELGSVAKKALGSSAQGPQETHSPKEHHGVLGAIDDLFAFTGKLANTIGNLVADRVSGGGKAAGDGSRRVFDLETGDEIIIPSARQNAQYLAEAAAQYPASLDDGDPSLAGTDTGVRLAYNDAGPVLPGQQRVVSDGAVGSAMPEGDTFEGITVTAPKEGTPEWDRIAGNSKDGFTRSWPVPGDGRPARRGERGPNGYSYSDGRYSPSGKFRIDSKTLKPRPHMGIDLPGKPGTPIMSAADGTVTYVGSGGGYGRIIRIRNADGTTAGYAHLSATNVADGDQVKMGDVIGAMGNTGNAGRSGTHLHFEVSPKGSIPLVRGQPRIDPTAWIINGKKQ